MSTRSVCSVTVMDDTDPEITFDADGVCNHVHAARKMLESECFRGEEGRRRMEELVAQIKKEGENKLHDCIIGLSGGVDSATVMLRAKEFGLRPLAIHLDNGWNSEIAVRNIERVLRKLDVDLYTYVVDWEEIKDLQRAFFKASVANVEAVTDHAIGAIIYKEAAHRNIRFVLSGSNVETESILPKAWGYDSRDARSIVGIHRRFGKLKKLKSYPILTLPEYLWYTFVRNVRFYPILNYGSYNKKEAMEQLQREFDWIPYERKHGESRFTRFFQEYYLPEKFHFDKRKAHFSSLIVAGQMTRDEAFAELNKPLLRPDERDFEIEYVTKKLGLSEQEWSGIMSTPPATYADYPNNKLLLEKARQMVPRFVKSYAKGRLGKAAPEVASAGVGSGLK